jgi:hypothetical protein
MFLSKILFILVALLAGVAVTFALVAPKPAVKKLEVLEGQRLDRAQYAAEQMFKVDAHKWIDRISKLGRDAIIVDALDSASRGAGEWGVLHKTVQDRFHALIPDLAGGGIEELGAIDMKGRVVARVGDNDKEYGDYISGAEVLTDSLRGYLSDDVWGNGGKLVRVASSPVLAKTRDRLVGAIYVGAETGTALVERLKKNLDVDVALLLRGKVVASTRNAAELVSLPDLIEKHATEISEVKRTPAIPLTSGQEKLLVVAAPFPGEAGQQQAYFALIGRQPAKSDLTSLLSNTSSDDLKWGNFPWVPLGGGAIIVIAIGLLAQRREVESPLIRLRRELQQLARGEIQKIQDNRYRGRFGGLARDVNAAMERYTHAPERPSEMAGKDLNAILGGPARPAGSTFDLPATDSAFAGSDPAPAFGPPPAPSFAPPPMASFAPPPASPFGPPPAPSFAPPPPFSATPLGGGGAIQTATAGQTQSPLPWTALPTAALDESAQPVDGRGEPSDSEATRVVPYDEDEEEAAHWRHVFEDFLSAKRQCGESTVGLTIDKFLQKLRDNKSALVTKHGCKTVRFSVYVKEGKAALKATPVRD